MIGLVWLPTPGLEEWHGATPSSEGVLHAYPDRTLYVTRRVADELMALQPGRFKQVDPLPPAYRPGSNIGKGRPRRRTR